MRSTDPDVQLLSALADPVRLSIVRQLAVAADVCACDFTECCTVSQPTISHHLKVLREAGVVVSERQGTTRNTISGLIRNLEERGLVDRTLDQQDRRKFNIRLSEAGRQMVADHSRRYFQAVESCFNGLTSAEQETLSDLLA